jgi:adenosine deaminase
MQTHFPAPLRADENPANVVARIADLLAGAASAGAVLVEPRFGNETVLRPDFFALLRAAEEQVPDLCVAPVAAVQLGRPEAEIERVLAVCLGAAHAGRLAGIDLLPEPYDTEADWRLARRIAQAAADAGLGIAAHAGEFSTANLRAALGLPGIARIGHATQAARDPELLERLASIGVTVECCLTSNVALGAVATLEDHPLPRFIASGVPVALGTDDPVELSTTIAREYELAASLGLDAVALTRNGIQASFAAPDRREELLGRLCLASGR